jgi:predicted ATPase
VLSSREVHGFSYLSKCLARAFGIKHKQCVECLQELNYVLTPDFTMKMLNISECMDCKSPLVISGETGVGKSFLIEALSRLRNLSAAESIKEQQTSLLNKIEEKGWGYFKC